MTEHWVTRWYLASLDDAGLVAECIDAFDIVVITPHPSREFDLLYAETSLHRVRFVIWAEDYRLSATGPEATGQPRTGLAAGTGSRTALGGILSDLYVAIKDANVLTERIQLSNVTSTISQEREPQQALSFGLSVFHNKFEAVRKRAQASSSIPEASRTVTRWSVHNLSAFAAVVVKIKGLLDALDGMTTSRLLEQRQSLTQAIQSITNEASLRLLQDVMHSMQQLSPVLSTVTDTVEVALKLVGKLREARRTAGSIAAEISLPRMETLPLLEGDSSTNPLDKPASGIKTLCEACSTISLAMLVHGFRHVLDFDQVLKSKDYCRFCALMLEGYESQTCVNLTKGRSCDKNHRGRLVWAVQSPGPGARFGMFKLDSSHYGKAVSIYTTDDSSLFKSGILTQRNVQAADSPRNIRLLGNWLEECCSGHDECKRGSYSGVQFDDVSGSTTLPHRIIDVGYGGDHSQPPRLVTTSTAGQTTGRYLTLSHCWGKIAPTKTEKSTLAAWHVQLPEKQLSKTFQDAIWLTRQLGERYLWIDSLCIVQDDPSDLAAQIGLMGVIFEQSYCTIAAVDAKGPDGLLPDRGLFLPRPNKAKMTHFCLPHKPLLTDPRRHESPYDIEAARAWHKIHEEDSLPEQLHDIFLEPANEETFFSRELAKRCWYSRGWVYQERELSRRCIFFADYTVAWRCNRYWETEQTGAPERRQPRDTFSFDPITAGGITFDIDHHVKKEWQHIITMYSQTKLSYIRDKHNALMGMEERLGSRCGARFRFGLLDFRDKEVFYSQMLWMPKVGRGSSLGVKPNFSCPSWSWLKIDGPVTFTQNQYLLYPEALSEIGIGEPTAGGSQQLSFSGPCHAIKFGPFIGDIPRHSQGERWPPNSGFGWSELLLDDLSTNTVLSATRGEVIGWVILDTADEQSEIIAAPLLRYLRMDNEEEPMCVDFLALALAKDLIPTGLASSNGQETYIRVGRGRVLRDALHWLESCQRRDFCVV